VLSQPEDSSCASSSARATSPGSWAGADSAAGLPAQAAATRLRIFVYDLPPEFNTALLSDARCGRFMFRSEQQVPLRMPVVCFFLFFFISIIMIVIKLEFHSESQHNNHHL
jgi:hypothetical protein